MTLLSGEFHIDDSVDNYNGVDDINAFFVFAPCYPLCGQAPEHVHMKGNV
jgi:hypothetical protein